MIIIYNQLEWREQWCW